jgi:hypothetical protein
MEGRGEVDGGGSDARGGIDGGGDGETSQGEGRRTQGMMRDPNNIVHVFEYEREGYLAI